MEIVQVHLKELDLVVPLFNAYRMFYKKTSDMAAARQFLAERIAKKESVIFLAITEENKQRKGVGFVQLYPFFSSVSMKNMWLLNDLFVLPEVRKEGVATQLIDKAKELALQTEAKGLFLETTTDNLSAQRLYEKVGFEKSDTVFYYYLSPI
jgi:ribosomal protein S18 acetylase RimI-like enzyme